MELLADIVFWTLASLFAVGFILLFVRWRRYSKAYKLLKEYQDSFKELAQLCATINRNQAVSQKEFAKAKHLAQRDLDLAHQLREYRDVLPHNWERCNDCDECFDIFTDILTLDPDSDFDTIRQ